MCILLTCSTLSQLPAVGRVGYAAYYRVEREVTYSNDRAIVTLGSYPPKS
jgi:hypothetical protein